MFNQETVVAMAMGRARRHAGMARSRGVGFWCGSFWPQRVLALLLLLVLLVPGLPGLASSPVASPLKALPAESLPDHCSTTPAWVQLDGKKVLEIRSAPGAQQLTVYANRGSRGLQLWASNLSYSPE